MSSIFCEKILPNGVTIRMHDRSYHYYGGFYAVVVEVECIAPLDEEAFESPAEAEVARKLFGESLTQRRRLERMGIAGGDIGRVRDELVSSFNGTLSYYSSDRFPQGLARTELQKALNRPHHSYSTNRNG